MKWTLVVIFIGFDKDFQAWYGHNDSKAPL